MEKIIVLYGTSNRGKSESLNILKNILRGVSSPSISSDDESKDKREIFDCSGKIICVTPAGDNKTIIDENFQFAKANNADVWVTASRTKGETVDSIYKYEQKTKSKSDWVKKSDESDIERLYEIANRETAISLLLKLNID